MFENYKVFSTEIAGRKLVVETGKIAQLANGSCLVRYGDTVVLCCATASASPREGIDFLPLSVDFEEKLYSVGRIPGSWNRREGRPSEKAILASRVIDRPIRPRFPKDLRNDVVLSLTVMSVDPDCSPEITGMIGASIALSISDIPWNGPIAGLFMGCVDGEIVTNPTADQRERSTLELTVASSADKVVMIEAGAKEIPDDVMFSAIMKAHEETKPIIEFINSIVAEIGKPKFEYPSCEVDKELYERIAALVTEDVKVALDTDDKKVRDARLKPIYDKVYEAFGEEYPDSKGMMDECLYKLQKSIVRRWLLDDQRRVDGRRMDEIRPLASEVSVLPRTHGSGLFTRGQHGRLFNLLRHVVSSIIHGQIDGHAQFLADFLCSGVHGLTHRRSVGIVILPNEDGNVIDRIFFRKCRESRHGQHQSHKHYQDFLHCEFPPY